MDYYSTIQSSSAHFLSVGGFSTICPVRGVMPTIMPHSELVRQAAEYIALELVAIRKEEGVDPAPARVYALVEKACMRFDLSPRDAGMLHDFLERGNLEE